MPKLLLTLAPTMPCISLVTQGMLMVHGKQQTKAVGVCLGLMGNNKPKQWEPSYRAAIEKLVLINLIH